MFIKKLVVQFYLILICLPVAAQNRTWGKLQISVTDGWSVKQNPGFIQLSNYNLTNAEPFTITLFDNQPYSGKPDTLFAVAWNKFVTMPPHSPEMPRWRRYYTEEGLLIEQGFVEFTQEGGPLYRQLNVILLPDSYQACMLETTSLKNYRLMQTDWMEKLQAVRQIQAAKK